MIRAALLLAMLASPAAAFDLSLPSTARLTVERDTDPDRYVAPVGVFAQGQVPLINVDGPVRRSAWRLDVPGLTPFQVVKPLKTQLEAAGFDIVLDCDSSACGGFDFRFATEVLPGPNMYVNIRAYHYVTALLAGGDGAPAQVVTVLASTSTASAYVQIIQAGEIGDAGVRVPAQTSTSSIPVATGDLSAQLLQRGHVVLDDLVFNSGSADLGEGPFGALSALAEFLKSRPDVRVALVGHTDSVGGLGGNIALSKRRAQSVRQRLIRQYQLPVAQLEAEGMGYLSPVASNLESAGRDANRRVEVVLLSAE